MEPNDIKKILEALMFITEQPIPLKTFETLFTPPVPKDVIEQLLNDLASEYRDRGSALEVREIAGGWQFSTRPEFAPYIRQLFKDRLTYRLSSSAMETLSIVAYKQPLTRSEIEEIRGVEVTAVLDTLVERRLIRIAGRKETVGRPLLYATTPDFLRAFGLKRLEDLPSVESLLPPTTSAITEEPGVSVESAATEAAPAESAPEQSHN
jgi:segregation and condensation protein B